MTTTTATTTSAKNYKMAELMEVFLSTSVQDVDCYAVSEQVLHIEVYDELRLIIDFDKEVVAHRTEVGFKEVKLIDLFKPTFTRYGEYGGEGSAPISEDDYIILDEVGFLSWWMFATNANIRKSGSHLYLDVPDRDPIHLDNSPFFRCPHSWWGIAALQGWWDFDALK